MRKNDLLQIYFWSTLLLLGLGCGPTPPVPDGLIQKDGGGPDGGNLIDKIKSDRQPDIHFVDTKRVCKSRCDCPQSFECVKGRCLSTTAPVYCCEKRGCPSGQACLSFRGGKSSCGAIGSLCRSACDCLDGLGCVNGQCTKFAEPIYCCQRTNACPAGAKCENQDGKESRCGGAPRRCKTACDCPQGVKCSQGQCVPGGTPAYCCSNPSCPSGKACVRPDGRPSICKPDLFCSSNTDCKGKSCTQQGTVCIQREDACFEKKCRSSSKNISNAQCSPSGVCRLLSVCKTHCDCPGTRACVNGQCVDVSGQPFWCCGDPKCPANAVCYRSDNSRSTCGSSAGACKGDKDCPRTTCADVVGDCAESRYTCDKGSGKCISNRYIFRSSLCEQAQGRCIPKGATCKVHCDCPQGQACLNGACSSHSTPTYCCGKAGCPVRNACSGLDGKAGVCGTVTSCSANADCGKAYCIQKNRDCVRKTPQCMSGSCTETSAIDVKKVCNTTTGKCEVGCFSDSDCKATRCKQSGKFCESLTERCLGGQCQGSTSSDVGTCNTTSGICKPPTSCASHCDCSQGNFCYQGKCARSSYPVYCCDNPGCPSGASCYGNRSQTPSRCPSLCRTPCDCPEGEDCLAGKCTQSSSPVFCCDEPSKCPTGAVCRDKNNNKSTCPKRPRPCKTACDCVQGEACTNGQCAQSSTPVYCCEKGGCPLGKGCVSKLQLSGMCPQSCNGHCDCPQGFNCIQGKCSNDPAITGPIYCCDNPGCPTNQVCYKANGRVTRCAAISCKSACDCAQGEDCRQGRCTRTNPPTYCCSQSGCPTGQSCKDSSNKWATCKTSTTCKSACDCKQGQDCYKGQCVGVHPAVYCCSKVGCPSGQACVDHQNKRNFCPTATCQTACDCLVQGQSCVNGRCVYLTGAAKVYCCNKPFCPAGQKCEDTQGNLKLCSKKSCKSPCDCNLGEDCQNGVCTNVSPPVYCCSASICPNRAACVKADGSNSICGAP